MTDLSQSACRLPKGWHLLGWVRPPVGDWAYPPRPNSRRRICTMSMLLPDWEG